MQPASPMRRAHTRLIPLGLAAGLAAGMALTALPALAETTSEIRYYPETTPVEAGGEGYLLYITTDAKAKADSPEGQIVFSCSAFADGVSFELSGEAAIAIPVTANDPEKPGELYPARFTAGDYDAAVSLDWVRWDEKDLEGVFTTNEELFAFEQAVVAATKLRAEAFGYAYDFDLAAVSEDLGNYLQGCFELTPTEAEAPAGD